MSDDEIDDDIDDGVAVMIEYWKDNPELYNLISVWLDQSSTLEYIRGLPCGCNCDNCHMLFFSVIKKFIEDHASSARKDAQDGS